MNHAEYLQHCALKLVHWQNRAESALTRKEALKALKKYAKWSRRLAEYEEALRTYRKQA